MLFHDLDQLRELRDLFKRRSDPPGLFHVTRARFDLKRDGETSLKRYWDEFLVDEWPFEFSCDEVRSGRLQQSCYFGAREKLNDYTGLALRAISLFPPGAVPVTFHHRDARLDRNQWTLGLYSASRTVEWNIAVDYRGNGAYAKLDLDTDAHFVLCGRHQTDAVRHFLRTWAGALKRRGIPRPRYIYAAIATDLFQASVYAINAYIEGIRQGKHQPEPGVWLPESMREPERKEKEDVKATGSQSDFIAEFRKTLNGKVLQLFDVLLRAQSRQSLPGLRDAVWEGDIDCSDQNIRVHLSRLRTAIRRWFKLEGVDPIPHKDGCRWLEKAVLLPKEARN